MSTVAANQHNPKIPQKDHWSLQQTLILVFLLLLLICGGEALWINLQGELRTVDQAIRAGASRQEVEEKLGKPRWVSQPREPLSELGWNGREKETISEFGLSVYDPSVFTFVICEFDEQGNLRKAIFSPK